MPLHCSFRVHEVLRKDSKNVNRQIRGIAVRRNRRVAMVTVKFTVTTQ